MAALEWPLAPPRRARRPLALARRRAPQRTGLRSGALAHGEGRAPRRTGARPPRGRGRRGRRLWIDLWGYVSL